MLGETKRQYRTKLRQKTHTVYTPRRKIKISDSAGKPTRAVGLEAKNPTYHATATDSLKNHTTSYHVMTRLEMFVQGSQTQVKHDT